MKILKRIISVILSLCLIQVSVYANSFDTTANSDLQIKVDKLVGDDRTTIYTRKLSGYENGLLSEVDFSDIQYMIIFVWDSNDTIYTISSNILQTNAEQKQIRSLNNNSSSLLSYIRCYSIELFKSKK